MATEIRRRSIALLLVSGLLALIFLFAGGTKVAGMQMHVEHFAKWGYPDWFRIVVGIIEVGGAVLLLVPSLALYGAVLLGIDMLGAIATHLRSNETANAPFPAVLLLLLVYVAYSRRGSAVSV